MKGNLHHLAIFGRWRATAGKAGTDRITGRITFGPRAATGLHGPFAKGERPFPISRTRDTCGWPTDGYRRPPNAVSGLTSNGTVMFKRLRHFSSTGAVWTVLSLASLGHVASHRPSEPSARRRLPASPTGSAVGRFPLAMAGDPGMPPLRSGRNDGSCADWAGHRANMCLPPRVRGIARNAENQRY